MRHPLWNFALCSFVLVPCWVGAQDAPTPSPVPSEPSTPVAAKLDVAFIQSAIRTDSITMPTPGELFEAFGNVSTPNWGTQYRQPIPMAFSKRVQIALNVGGLIADGYLAVEGMDSQQVKNVGKDIISLAQALGVSEQVLSRGNSITEFAENNEWIALKEELEATQDEVKLAMEEMSDQDLVTLVSLGGWLRGTQAVTGLLLKDYTPETAAIVRQPELIAYIRSKLGSLSDKSSGEPIIQSITKELGEMQQILTIPAGEVPTKEQVQQLNQKASALLTEITTK